MVIVTVIGRRSGNTNKSGDNSNTYDSCIIERCISHRVSILINIVEKWTDRII